MQIKNITRHHFSGVVHNIGVVGDESYTVHGVKVKNCRGIWVEIMLSEEDLPPIDGIPQSIKDRFGNMVNDLIQPRVPQTKKGTLARQEVERRAKRAAARTKK